MTLPDRRFTLASLTPQPWKNGGGVTREIAVMPAGAGMDDFLWRISVAEIASSGPFSRFAGIDRQIMLLEGDGVHLHGSGIDHRLGTPLAPFAFDGEAALGATLLGGVTHDLNVMTRRGAMRADVHVLRRAARLPACDALMLLALGGRWAPHGLQAGEGALWIHVCGAHELVPDTSTDAALVAICLTRLATP